MAFPRVKIVCPSGTDRDVQILFREHADDDWVNLNGVVSKIEWELEAGELARALLTIPLPQLEAAADDVRMVVEHYLKEPESVGL